MKMYLSLVTLIIIAGRCECVESSLNNRPIIGVLAQELNMEPYKSKGISYIAASYVKFVEGSGARVIPIMINKTQDYYEKIASSVNGILLPGGGTYFDTLGGYAEAGDILFKLALEMNRADDYFPIWGTCLGFELLTYIAADGIEHRARCNSYNEALPLELKKDFFKSRLFEKASYDIIGILAKENVTANFHGYCLTLKNVTELKLEADWMFMTTNQDANGLEFISTLEHRTFPFYGVQFHPEKNNYEWKRGKMHPHSAEGIRISQYFSNFFVNEARRNHHKFPSEEEEKDHLIYNYPVLYTGRKSFFEQIYAFEP